VPAGIAVLALRVLLDYHLARDQGAARGGEMAFRGTRIWARISIVVGVVVMILGIALSILVPLAVPIAGYAGSVERPFELIARLGAALVLVLLTLLLTAPLIASGEMLLVLLDIRKRSVRIERRLKRRRSRQADRGLVNRLRPR
jgi:hypothetical protein